VVGEAGAYTCTSHAIQNRGSPAGRGNDATAEMYVRLTDQTLSCAARAHVATAARHAACLHVRRAMQAA